MSDNAQDEVRCPKCGSAKIHAEKRGWNIWVGFIGSGKIVITCLACGHKFKPGEGVQPPQATLPSPSSHGPKSDEDDRGIPTYKLD
jgi:DNA-directed RNA polymerase subunit RPC12/RpoP